MRWGQNPQQAVGHHQFRAGEDACRFSNSNTIRRSVGRRRPPARVNGVGPRCCYNCHSRLDRESRVWIPAFAGMALQLCAAHVLVCPSLSFGTSLASRLRSRRQSSASAMVAHRCAVGFMVPTSKRWATVKLASFQTGL
jgi:hypothetical protein